MTRDEDVELLKVLFQVINARRGRGSRATTGAPVPVLNATATIGYTAIFTTQSGSAEVYSVLKFKSTLYS
jgi:hypothetical protein